MANAVYDPEDTTNSNYPDLAKAEDKAGVVNKNSSAANNTAGSTNKYLDFGKTPSSDKLSAAEGADPVAAKLGKGYTSSISSALQKTPIRTSRTKRNLFIGGGTGGIILSVILIIASIVPFELVHIEKVLIGYESKIIKRAETKSTNQLMQKIVCKAIPSKCKLAPTNTPEDENTAEGDGKALQADLDNVSLSDPVIDKALASEGITETTGAGGAITGLEDLTGNDITNNVTGNTTDMVDLDNAEWGASQINRMDPILEDDFHANLTGIAPDTAEDEVDSAVENDIINDDNYPDTITAAPDSQDSSKPASDFTTAESESGPLGTATAEAAKLVQQGVPPTEAVEVAASDATKGLNVGLITTSITLACDIDNEANKDAANRVPTIQTLLIRHATALFSITDEFKSGKLSSTDVNQVMGLFNGDPNALATKSNPKPQAAQPFSSSAAWQSATGGSGGTPIQQSSLPTANTGTHIVNEIDTLVPGSKDFCSVVGSPFGFLITGAIGIVALFSDIGSFGTSEVAQIAANTAVIATMKEVVIPDIIDYFTPFSLEGAEDSVQWLNNADAGGNLMFGNYARSLGAAPVPYSAADALTSEANNEQEVASAHLPLSSRLFSLNDPTSLASSTVNNLPLGLSSTISTLEGYFTRLPSILLNSFSSIFSGHGFAAATPSNPDQPYGITAYAIPDQVSAQYDPVANENYLFKTISYHGSAAMSRISMLGNPSDFPSGEEDSSTTDLLHCFIDNSTTTLLPGTAAANSCYGIGNYDEESNPVTAMTTNTENTDVAEVYCAALGQTNSSSDPCVTSLVNGQVDNDFQHFQQYLLDLNSASDLKSLVTSQ